MEYQSTRAAAARLSFSETLLTGLAKDGGLIVPTHYPQLSLETIESWRFLSYQDLALALMRLFISDIPEDKLRTLINAAYSPENFPDADITPIKNIGNDLYLLHLSNGPTLAFKDIAMQLLGQLFEYVLEQQNKQLNILGATSGDTGSAAEYAMRARKNIQVFMLSPAGKMSDFQRAQMYSLQDANIYNIAIEGVFDDCQDLVKGIQSNLPFKNRFSIGTVNSINWGRILAQIVYYFKGYFAVTTSIKEKVTFCVPSGNFGNVCAAHVARSMGLPVARLLVATNENNVLEEFFNTGVYCPRPPTKVHITSSPSMDIAKASNLERFIFDLLDRDPEILHNAWQHLQENNSLNLSHLLPKIKDLFGFYSAASCHHNRLETIRSLYFKQKQLVDPHTADGVFVAQQLKQPGETVITLETALPIKFESIIKEALGKGFSIPRPAPWQGIEKRVQQVTYLHKDLNALQDFIQQHEACLKTTVT